MVRQKHSLHGLVAIAVIALCGTGAEQAIKYGPSEPIQPEMAEFLQYQFESVPAPSIAKNVPGSSCRQMTFETGELDSLDGAPMLSIYVCDVDFGCGQPESVPVWKDGNGTLWFGPDSVERLVAMLCSDSISDPERRNSLINEVQQGG